MTPHEPTPHDRYRELLALALYGELDSREQDTLTAHLEGCSSCRAFERELHSGLGRLARRAPAAAAQELPSDWHEALRQRIQDEPRARPARGLVFAAGLAAGLTLALALHSGSPETAPAREVVGAGRFGPPFQLRAEAPRLAEGAGTLARLARSRPR